MPPTFDQFDHPDVTIRLARLDDSLALRCTQVAAWRTTYRGVMQDAYLDAMDPDDDEWWRAVLAGLHPQIAVAVADPGDGTIAGFANVGPARNGEPSGELFAINCHPDWIGRGVGHALLTWAEAELGRLGHRRAVLWVVDSNARARRFYERHGWAADGTAQVAEIGGAAVPEVRYAKDGLPGPPL